MACLAAVIITGIFNRITFIAFTAPIAVRAIIVCYQEARPPNLARLSSHVLYAGSATVLTSTAIIALDSYYFRDGGAPLVFTPYNFLLYNLSPDNLAKHGLHPRWLHVAVNLPMIVGPCVLISGMQAGWQVLRHKSDNKGKPTPHTSRMTAVGTSYVSQAPLPAEAPRSLH